MHIELWSATALLVLALSFFTEFVDSTLGMGYGTALTPLLLLLGFDPLEVVPAILVSELATGFAAGLTHHRAGNVDLRPRTLNPTRVLRALRAYGVGESFRRGLPRALRVALFLGLCGIVGAFIGAQAVIGLPGSWVRIYIGLLVLAAGALMLTRRGRPAAFSWRKVTALGLVASFNKGLSGGGYGPLVTSGQILSGIQEKHSIGITSVAEGMTCLAGAVVFAASGTMAGWGLAPYLMAGALLSTPFTALAVRRLDPRRLKGLVGVLACGLGSLTLLKEVL